MDRRSTVSQANTSDACRGLVSRISSRFKITKLNLFFLEHPKIWEIKPRHAAFAETPRGTWGLACRATRPWATFLSLLRFYGAIGVLPVVQHEHGQSFRGDAATTTFIACPFIVKMNLGVLFVTRTDIGRTFFTAQQRGPHYPCALSVMKMNWRS